MAQRPGRANGRGNGARNVVTKRPQPTQHHGQHGRLATEQMRHPGNVENEIAKWRLVLQHADQRAGIGMPVGKFGKGGSQKIGILLEHGQAGQQGAGIGKSLPEPQACGLRLLVHGHQPQPALDLFIQRQRRLEAGINPFEILGRPIGQMKAEKPALREDAGGFSQFGQGGI